MKLFIKIFETGNLYVGDISPPPISNGNVLIENKYSLIIAEAEISTASVKCNNPFAWKEKLNLHLVK